MRWEGEECEMGGVHRHIYTGRTSLYKLVKVFYNGWGIVGVCKPYLCCVH